MSRVDRARRHRLIGLVAVAFIVGALASPSATARPDEAIAPVRGTAASAPSQAEGGQPDVNQFGGYIASARANGLQMTYDSPGLLPVGSPIVQLSIPESLSTLNTGPVGYGLASFAFPGPLVADLGSALAAGGTETGIPSYPVRAEAFFPSGPTEASGGEGGTIMAAITEFADSKAYSTFSAFELGPVGTVGSIKTDTRSDIEGTQLYARAAVEMGNISLIAGLIEIESVRTDLIATSNGRKSATSGGTTVSGVTVLGLPATIDENGISFSKSEPPEGSPTTPPTTSALGGALSGTPLADVLDPDELLSPVVGPLNDLLEQVGGAGDDVLQQLFEASGIEIKMLGSDEQIDGGSASRNAGGLSININYDGENTPVLTDLVSLIPTDLLPADNLGPIPFSPQALVNLLKKVHVTGIALAPANVSATATPAFTVDIPPFTPPTPEVPAIVPTPSAGTNLPTPSANIPSVGSGATAPARVPAVPVSSTGPFPFGLAIPAALIIAALFSSPFLAAGTSRLADNSLAEEVLSCPEGLDRPRIQEPPQ